MELQEIQNKSEETLCDIVEMIRADETKRLAKETDLEIMKSISDSIKNIVSESTFDFEKLDREPIKMVAKPIIEERYAQLKEEIKTIEGKIRVATILVGDKPDSELYVKMKHKKCEEVGICSDVLQFPEGIQTEQLEAEIKKIIEYGVHDGILIQLPLPSHIDQKYILEKFGHMLAQIAKRPLIDVDGLTQIGKLSGVIPCTPKGIIKLLDYYKIDMLGKHVVIVGRSEILGKPLAKICQDRDATVSVVHSRTPKLLRESLICTADIIISCAGSPNLIQPIDIVIGDKVVVDAGVTIIDGKSIGDVNEECYQYLYAYTPYTGAVGPMTILSLVENIVESAKNR